MRSVALFLSLCGPILMRGASPVDFGRRELQAALESRGLKPDRFRVITEHSMVLPADGFSIQGQLIRGGNLRGIMYGLLEAASQIRSSGWLRSAKGAPAHAVRGVRWERPLPDDPAPLFVELARARFNRFVAANPGDAMEKLRRTSELAAAHGLDFGVVLPPGASGKAYLAELPLIKYLEVRPARPVLDDLQTAGRLFTLDLDASGLDETQFTAAVQSRIPLQICAEPESEGSFFKKPEVSERTRMWQVIWRIRPSPAAGPKMVRSLLESMAAGETSGFELVAPLNPGPRFYEVWGRLAYDPSVADTAFDQSRKARTGLLEALEAASILPPDEPVKSLEMLLEWPKANAWMASPAEAARLRLEGKATAKLFPLDRAAAWDAAADALEKAAAIEPELHPLAVHARNSARRLSAAAHLAWARASGETAGRFAGTVSRPAFQHTPPKQTVAGRPLSLNLTVTPSADVRVARLHWRPLQLGPWRTIETPASKAVFTVPAEAITPAYDIEYFFEILHAHGGGWFHPENVAGTFSARFVVTVVREPE